MPESGEPRASQAKTTTRLGRAQVAIAAALALTSFGSIAAQASTGCTAINSGLLNHQVVYASGAPSAGTTAAASYSTATYNTARSSAAWTDPFDPAMNYVPNNTTFYAFDQGDRVIVSGNFTATSGTELRLRLRLGSGTSAASNITEASILTSASGSFSTAEYTLPAGTTAVGLTTGRASGASGTIVASMTCTPAQSAPTLSSFTYGSIVGYNPGGAAATNIDVATGGSPTNSPTSYSVSNAPGGTFAGSAATSGGGTVSINSAGQASYTPRIGYRGTDTFFARATNGGGTSSPATVTLAVGNPTITASLTGSGATVGSGLSGYAVTPTGGNAPYSCVLNAGSAVLPGGVTLNSNCTLTGTPTTPGTYSFNVDITDSSVTGANGGTASPFTQANVAVTNFVITQSAPTVTGLAPALGGTAGGTSVVITGTNFYNVTGVSFGGNAAAAYTRNSASQITATSPSGSGAVYVVVTTTAGASPTAAGNQFVYSDPPSTPVVTVPANGAVTGSTTPAYQGVSDASVTITVLIDGASIGTTTATGSGTWTKAQPVALAAGSHTVAAFATNAQSQSSATSGTNTFTVTPAPVASNYTLPVAITYNAGANTATAFSIAGQVSNNPTSYAVGSATSANGGTVSVNNSGVVTYIAAIGFRGSDSFTYTASNAGGTSNVATVTVSVANPALSGTLSGSGTRGAPLSNVRIIPAGGRQPYSCGTTLASGALPAGTSLQADCSITGTPAASGSFSFTANVTDSSTPAFTQATGTLTLVVSAPALTLSPAAGALPGGTVATAYSQTFTASGGTPPFSFTSAGTLPTGLSLSAGGVLSGNPTTAGTFNFTVTATDSSSAGSGGPYSVSNSYSLTIAPQAPVAGAVSATVAYNSTNNPITPTLSGGATSSVAIASAPAHGTATASGTTIAYTPTPGYIGADSFTYTATGPGGTSSPATASITVSPPPAPTAANVSGIAVPYGSSGTAIDLSSAITGVHSGVTVTTAPAHGTTSVAGDVVTYTPAAGYYGADSFAYTANGPGGTSNTATASLTVATPAAPVAADRNVAVAYNTAAAIDLSGSISGVHSSLTVVSAPAHGAVSVAGDVVTYTPATGYFGADSFTYTATGPGGTSNIATVNLTVATPAAPVAADRTGVTIAYNSAGTPIDLSASVSGVHSSIAVATAPAHGTTSVSGDVVTYVPAAGYYGADSFTYTATGPGGTSAPATVSLNVATPAAPITSDRTGVTVAYGSTGTAIDLSASVSGVHSSIAVATAPAHGTTSVSGDVVTYVPVAGYYGADSFTYTATGPGGTSAPATVSLNVATPAAPVASDRTGVTVAYGSTGTAIDLSASVSGVHSSIAVATAPAHGTTSVTGDVVTYVPAAGYYGADSFTYTATGPGGTSAPATVSLTVATPAAPSAANVSGVGIPYNGTGTAIDVSASVTGVYGSIAVASGPAHGTTSVSGSVITYTPATGYYGADSFTYTATGPGGTSAPATVSVTVATPSAPTTTDVSNVAVPFGSSGVAIDLSSSIGGVHSSVAVASAPAHGTTSISGDVVTYTPAAGYYGPDSFTYTATGPGGTSAPATVSVNVAVPPAPTAGDRSGIAVPYQGSTPIDLSSSIGGVHSSVAVTGGPAHGTTSISGDVVTYTPAAGYYGPDSFTYTATGPGGTSAPATVSVDVAVPPAPTASDRSGVAVPYQGSAAIDLSSSISGVHSSVAVASAPAHGTASVSGDVVTYTPAAGYYGADSFTYTATGPGGTSAPATVSVNVAVPPAPTANDRSGVAVPYQGSVAIDLSTSIGGVHSSVAVTGGPAHGTTSVSGDVVTYTPAPGYYGTDSFTYTATGPGGTSAPATVSVNVAVPPAPTASDRSGIAVPYQGSVAIDLSSSIGGVHSSVAVASAPAHGTTSISGDVVTYTPAAGYYGPDSFTYTATGPGGTSAPATVSVNVAVPPAPTAGDRSGIAVPYQGSTPIDLSSSIGGVHSSVAVTGGPAHGTTSISGDVVTYTPAAGYYGPDSFTYTATGPGGTSAPATVSVDVAVPPAPTASDRSGVAVPYQGSAAIDLSSSISGVHSSVAVASAPAHGTASVSGDVVTYTPAAGYYGADSFTYTATGPGGTSAPATVSVNVAVPPAPTANDRSGVAVPYQGSVAIDLSTSIGGVHSSVAVTGGPAHGTTSVSGDVVTYTPAPGYYGTDSFTYTATGPGGTSAPAIVSVNVAVPPAPTAANVSNVAVPYDSTGTAIDLTSAISGVHTSTAIATNPGHGTVTVAGDVVTYIPTTGYYGTDSFTYTATGPGGTSAPATVTLQVAVPPAPSAANVPNVAVPYGSTGTAIDLTSAITGIHTSTAIATPPGHGTVTVSGDVVTYIPTAGYYGTDSFTYTATGPGGTSTPATVTLQVAVPPVPTVTDRGNVAIPYNSAGTAIDLASDIGGVYTGIAVAAAPAHGTVTVAGSVATYIPATDYYGADSFTYTATGPGGTSAPATVRLVVAPPPPPQAGNGAGSVAGSTATTGAQSVDVDLSALVTGTYDRIEIRTQPAHGTVTLRGNPAARAALAAQAATGPRVIATYTAAVGFVGTDSFTFVAVGPGGSSAPGTVSVTVVGQLPVALPKTARIGDGQTVSVMLTDGAREGPFTAATIVSVTPADQASATIVASGSGATQAYRLDVKAAARFGGTVVVTYTLSNAYGTSAPATVTVTVTARPDPTNDPNVRAISDAQAEATRRFARAQVGNFMRRTEQLHGSGSGTGGAQSNVTLNSRDGGGIVQATPAFDASALDITERMRPSAEDPALGRVLGSREGLRWNRADQLGSTMAITEMTAAERNAARKASGVAGAVQPLAQDDEQGGDGVRRIGSIGIWSGGAIDIGTQDETTDRSKITATSAGLSAGADLKLAEGVTVGLGGGYGNDLSRIDGGAARVRSDSTMVAAYASLVPVEHAFIDGMIGLGDLRFRTRRVVPDTNATAVGSRDGDFRVGALAVGIDRQGEGFNWSLYGRGEVLDATLGAYVESGADRFDLRFDERKLTSVTGTLGARFELKQNYVFGTVMPRVRAEWNHEFADADAQRLDYADIPGSALYGIETQGWSREQFQLSLGTRFLLPSLWSFDFETVFRGASGQRSGSVRAQVTKEF
ncbi:Ig-like domain-containing protein [Sphingomonas sp. S2-65]|uniref:Ig-like domain-containing protein n=1 Tax=Sphingomonas sp. S2-65 TaxID=2903960 RepID=UPI001F491864|nr:Ig-like domain-containing protein [Sphingomonas sp. S2-65]UYY57372.1 Ig-like domain-containing protein [Sphingomonas sp. S2-65]